MDINDKHKDINEIYKKLKKTLKINNAHLIKRTLDKSHFHQVQLTSLVSWICLNKPLFISSDKCKPG